MVWDSTCKNLPTSPSTADGRRKGIPGEEFPAPSVPWKEKWRYSREMLVSSSKMWNSGCEWPGQNPQRNASFGRGLDKLERSEGSSLLEKGTGIRLSCSLGCCQKSNPCFSPQKEKGKIWQIPQKILSPLQSINLSVVTEPLPILFFLFIKTSDQFFSDTTALSWAGSIIHEHENSGIRKKTCHKFSYLSF